MFYEFWDVRPMQERKWGDLRSKAKNEVKDGHTALEHIPLIAILAIV